MFAKVLFSLSPGGHFNDQNELKIMLMQNVGEIDKEYYGMLWYFLLWSIRGNE